MPGPAPWLVEGFLLPVFMVPSHCMCTCIPVSVSKFSLVIRTAVIMDQVLP